MEVLYVLCAVVGGTLLVCQFLMTLLGLGGHHEVGHDGGIDHDVGHDAGHDHGHDSAHGHDAAHAWFVGILTFRTIVAALTFFGLAGLAASAGLRGSTIPWATLISLAVALAAGAAAMFGVAAMMRGLLTFRADGTARIERTIGKHGTVYLRIPAQNAGVGKVTVNVQNRSMEYLAITSHEELPTGSKVVVVGVVSPDTLEVLPAAASERTDHD